MPVAEQVLLGDAQQAREDGDAQEDPPDRVPGPARGEECADDRIPDRYDHLDRTDLIDRMDRGAVQEDQGHRGRDGQEPEGAERPGQIAQPARPGFAVQHVEPPLGDRVDHAGLDSLIARVERKVCRRVTVRPRWH